jgi:hypothetical protein
VEDGSEGRKWRKEGKMKEEIKEGSEGRKPRKEVEEGRREGRGGSEGRK